MLSKSSFYFFHVWVHFPNFLFPISIFNLIADQNTQSIDKLKTQLSNLEAITIPQSPDTNFLKLVIAADRALIKRGSAAAVLIYAVGEIYLTQIALW